VKVIFCADLLNNKKVDMDNPEAAIRKIKPSGELECAIYRGWMLKPDRYGDLY
jgi:hypothetical protein